MVGPRLLACAECMFELLSLVQRYNSIHKLYWFRRTVHRVFMRLAISVLIQFQASDSNGKRISMSGCYSLRNSNDGMQYFSRHPLHVRTGFTMAMAIC